MLLGIQFLVFLIGRLAMENHHNNSSNTAIGKAMRKYLSLQKYQKTYELS